MINIDSLISTALKEQKKDELKTLRLIKTEFLKKETEPNRKTKELSEEEQIKVLLKMATVRKETITEYQKNNRPDLAEIEETELNVIQQFLPILASDEEIAGYANEVIDDYLNAKNLEAIIHKEKPYCLTMKDMSPILKLVKVKYNAESSVGQVVSTELKKRLV